MKSNFSKYKSQYAFAAITFVYIFSWWITFKGFNGTDDLHYAMLATNMLHGKYNPFAVNDIFSGRILLIAFQALIYFLGGINVCTTQLGTMIITVLCCYLTAFKLTEIKSNSSVIAASSLFYFNPVLNEANLGVMPDVYVMLAGIFILLLWRNTLKEQNQQRIILNSILTGLTVFAGMFFKENALIFIPFLFCTAFLNNKSHGLKAGLISILTFCFLIFLSGCMYHYFTGDFFFRVQQIKTADYPNPCNYNSVQGNELVARLTYGVWKDFIVESFYPVILASVMIVLEILFDKEYSIRKYQWTIYFIILVMLGLYFPFSLSGYQPLCFKARHFLFLLPLGVTISTSFFEDSWNNKRVLWLFIIASAILLAVCIKSTGEKWYWMMYGFLFAYFVLQKLLPRNSSLYKLKDIMFAAILWIYMPYHLFFINSDWFKSIQFLTKKLDGHFFYFPEHDNMMHWKLLHGFDSSFHSYNLEKEPFKVFVPYYEKPEVFHPGWFIVNKKYTTRSPEFLNRVDSLKHMGYFSKQISIEDVSAFFISNPSQLFYLKTIIAEDVEVFR
ncbi:MAG TPA: hypothetical protein VH396_02970 [Chitinophagaceae bacterium]